MSETAAALIPRDCPAVSPTAREDCSLSSAATQNCHALAYFALFSFISHNPASVSMCSTGPCKWNYWVKESEHCFEGHKLLQVFYLRNKSFLASLSPQACLLGRQPGFFAAHHTCH